MFRFAKTLPRKLFLFFAVAGAAFVAYLFHWQYLFYIDCLEYLPETDYSYAFDGTAAETAPIQLSKTSFAWPDGAREFDTVFLDLPVSSSILGHFVDPRITVEYKGLRFFQYVERGAHGRRYINLSPLAASAPAPGEQISLRGEWLSWTPGSARLIFFNNRPISGRPTLIIAPHPDDAELGATVYFGSNTWVVTMTAGDAGTLRYAGFADKQDHYRWKGFVRVLDSLSVPRLGMVPPAQIMNLGYPDGTLMNLYGKQDKVVPSPWTGLADVSFFRQHNVSPFTPPAPPQATWKALVQEMSQLINRIRPEIVIAPHPLLDSHSDHQLTAVAVWQALAASNVKNGKLLLYTNHIRDAEMLPFGPPEGLLSLPISNDKNPMFFSVYSPMLTREQLLLKKFMLEAMHDLRYSPTIERPELRSLRTDVELKALRLNTDLLTGAARPNEIFFVVPFDRMKDFFPRFLEQIPFNYDN